MNVEHGQNYCHIYLKKEIILIRIILKERVTSFMILFITSRFMNYFKIQKSIISLCPKHVFDAIFLVYFVI